LATKPIIAIHQKKSRLLRAIDLKAHKKHTLEAGGAFMSDFSVNQGGQVQNKGVNDHILLYLKEASPWLRFIGIVYYIVCGFMVAGGLISLIAAPLMENLDIDGTTGFLTGIGYLVSAVIMFFPARFIYSFGARLRNYFLSNKAKELELAFKYNKSLWKFYGVMTIVILALIPIGISLVIYATIEGYF
jgi:hypothetical protein